MIEMLRRSRKCKNLTVNDMAYLLKISPSYYSQIENGKRNLDYKMAVKISSIFGLLPDDIFHKNYKKYINEVAKPKTITVIEYY